MTHSDADADDDPPAPAMEADEATRCPHCRELVRPIAVTPTQLRCPLCGTTERVD